ncbi:MAG: glutamine synthetase family protein [Pseudomonadota bacterium]
MTPRDATPDFTAEFAAYTAQHGTPSRIECMLCDLNGVLRGKWLPGEAADKLTKGAVRLPLSTYAPNILGEEVPESGLGIVVGDPDGVLTPIPGTLKPVPWFKGAAQVLVEMNEVDGSAFPYSPRRVLQAVLDRFADRGLHPVVATELEFYVVQRRAAPDEPPKPPDPSPTAQNYCLEVLARHDEMLTEILAACAAQGLDTDTLIAEYGPGQFEINFHHTADVQAAAETAVLFRRLVRGVTDDYGLEATFMAKPYADSPGNGMHAHVSVIDDQGANVFSAESGLGPELAGALAGCIVTAPDLQAVFAPHLNSYRRFQPMSFAPSAPDWGFDNRAAGLRLPATAGPAARLEHRIAGADVNPYLMLTAVLGGMLWGLEHRPPLPPALDAPDATPAEPLTADWATAVDRLATSPIAADILGTRYRDAYVAVRRDEIMKLTSQITRLEYRTYLTRL